MSARAVHSNLGWRCIERDDTVQYTALCWLHEALGGHRVRAAIACAGCLRSVYRPIPLLQIRERTRRSASRP
jgi:hypothetical protein